MAKQTYQKYGGFAQPDFKSMVAGQAAVGDSIKEAFGGVKDLLAQVQEGYKEKNTLNMQEYLKGQLKEQGLGADPLDKTAVMQRFGSMINMDQLEQGFNAEKQQMESSAIDTASKMANSALGETDDPLAARKAFENQLRELGGKENFVSTATQAWSDTNASKFQDIKELDLRQQLVRNNDLSMSLVEHGVDGGEDAIEVIVSQLPERKQAPERERLLARLEADKELTPDQIRRKAGYLKTAELAAQRRVNEYEHAATTKEAELQAVSSGIPDDIYQVAAGIRSQFDGNVANAIGDRLTNIIERLAPNNDKVRFGRIDTELRKMNLPIEDREAAIAAAFYNNYGGDGILFNDMTSAQIDRTLADAKEYATNMLKKKQLSGELASLRFAASSKALEESEKLNELDNALHKAAQNKKVRARGAGGMDTFMEQYMGGVRAEMTPPPQQTNTGGGGGSTEGTGTPAPQTADERKAAVEQRKIALDNQLSNDPNVDPNANDVTNLDNALKRREGNTTPPVKPEPKVEPGSLRDIQSGINTSGLSDNPVNRAVTGAVDSTFDFIKENSLPGMAARLGPKVGNTIKDGAKFLQNLGRNRYSGLAESVNTPKQEGALTEEEMNVQTEDPVKWAANNKKVENKVKNGNLLLGDLTSDITITPEINDYISKMNSLKGHKTDPIEMHVKSLKKQSKSNQARILETIWTANPELAKEIAELLGLS